MLSFKFVIVLSIGIVSLLSLTSVKSPTQLERDSDDEALKNKHKKSQKKQPVVPPSVKIDRARVIRFLEEERRESPNKMEVAYFRNNPDRIHAQMIDVLNKEFGHLGSTDRLMNTDRKVLPHTQSNGRNMTRSSHV